jgi:hypothetical protein
MLESDPKTKHMQIIGVKKIEEEIHCLNCDKLFKEHSKNGLVRCFYVVQSHAVKWGSELRERQQAEQHQMQEMDIKQVEDIKEDQKTRIGHKTVGIVDGEEVHMMENEEEIPDDDPHKIRFLKDNPQWKTQETPLTEEQKKMLKGLDKKGGDMKVVGLPNAVETIKDGKPTGNKPKKIIKFVDKIDEQIKEKKKKEKKNDN